VTDRRGVPRREVPEADALEQETPVTDEPERGPLTDRPEVDEADALEQAEPVPLDEDDEHR
jgi:hypothetical protein